MIVMEKLPIVYSPLPMGNLTMVLVFLSNKKADLVVASQCLDTKDNALLLSLAFIIHNSQMLLELVTKHKPLQIKEIATLIMMIVVIV
jgi:hypothetical protein